MPKGIPRDQSTQRKIIHRLKIARGHLDKVIAMIEEDEYCIDVVHQSGAVISAIKKANQELLENHLRHCLVHEMKSEEGEEMIEEIVEVIRKT